MIPHAAAQPATHAVATAIAPTPATLAALWAPVPADGNAVGMKVPARPKAESAAMEDITAELENTVGFGKARRFAAHRLGVWEKMIVGIWGIRLLLSRV